MCRWQCVSLSVCQCVPYKKPQVYMLIAHPQVGLWDAFFSNTRSGSKHSSVLQPDPLPFENYLHGAAARGEGRPHIQVSSQQ